MTEWGSFHYTVMPFGLKNAPAIFSRVVVAVFKEYIHKFLEVYFDDWTVFGLIDKHIGALIQKHGFFHGGFPRFILFDVKSCAK